MFGHFLPQQYPGGNIVTGTMEMVVLDEIHVDLLYLS